MCTTRVLVISPNWKRYQRPSKREGTNEGWRVVKYIGIQLRTRTTTRTNLRTPCGWKEPGVNHHALCDSTYVAVWNGQRSPVVSVEQKSEEGGQLGQWLAETGMSGTPETLQGGGNVPDCGSGAGYLGGHICQNSSFCIIQGCAFYCWQFTLL